MVFYIAPPPAENEAKNVSGNFFGEEGGWGYDVWYDIKRTIFNRKYFKNIEDISEGVRTPWTP